MVGGENERCLWLPCIACLLPGLHCIYPSCSTACTFADDIGQAYVPYVAMSTEGGKVTLLEFTHPSSDGKVRTQGFMKMQADWERR